MDDPLSAGFDLGNVINYTPRQMNTHTPSGTVFATGTLRRTATSSMILLRMRVVVVDYTGLRY